MVWPTLGSRTAKEQNRTLLVALCAVIFGSSRLSEPKYLRAEPEMLDRVTPRSSLLSLPFAVILFAYCCYCFSLFMLVVVYLVFISDRMSMEMAVIKPQFDGCIVSPIQQWIVRSVLC